MTKSPEVFCKNGVPKKFARYTGKHLYQTPAFNTVKSLRSAILLKIDSDTGVFQ